MAVPRGRAGTDRSLLTTRRGQLVVERDIETPDDRGYRYSILLSLFTAVLPVRIRCITVLPFRMPSGLSNGTGRVATTATAQPPSLLLQGFSAPVAPDPNNVSACL